MLGAGDKFTRNRLYTYIFLSRHDATLHSVSDIIVPKGTGPKGEPESTIALEKEREERNAMLY